MIPLNRTSFQLLRLPAMLLVIASLVSACSSSSEPNPDATQPASDATNTVGNNNGNPGDTQAQTGETETVTAASTNVDFRITVPAYQSNALQVRLDWGTTQLYAAWNVDELWTVSGDLPINTDNPLVVSFNDRNGGITLGQFETNFRTGAGPSESFTVTADQFSTAQWDSDGDGVSNLDELIAGTNPDGSAVPEPVAVNLELVADKTFRISWEDSPAASYYDILENLDGVSGYYAVANNIGAGVQTYDHRVALYKRANAQYIVQACNSSGCSYSETLSVTGTLDQAIGYFKSPNPKSGVVDTSHGSPITIGADHFGSSVNLSADGSTLVMAATQEDSSARGINGSQSDDSVNNSGAVYVFVRSDNQWALDAYIKASNTDQNDNFGSNIALSEDGNTFAVGVPVESSSAAGINGDQENNDAYQSGAVYVFSRSNGVWQQQSYIKASNAQSEDQFGYDLDISGDGNTIVVGARYEDGSGRSVNSEKDEDGYGNGAAYVFTRSGETWSEQAYLKPSNSDEYDNFGSAVRISGDGSTIAVVSKGEDSISMGINGDQFNDVRSIQSVGAVYVFVRNNDTWQQEAYVKGSAYRDGYDFGRNSIDLNGDGSTLAVGLWLDSNMTAGLDSAQFSGRIGISGSVYIFTRNNSSWQQQAFLKASNAVYNGLFGSSVRLSSDGNTLAVASSGESGGSTGVNGDQYNKLGIYVGAVYTFERSGDAWLQQSYIKASNTDVFDGFGRSISLSADGNSLAVGASSERGGSTGINTGDQSDNSAPGSGAVYLY